MDCSGAQNKRVPKSFDAVSNYLCLRRRAKPTFRPLMQVNFAMRPIATGAPVPRLISSVLFHIVPKNAVEKPHFVLHRVSLHRLPCQICSRCFARLSAFTSALVSGKFWLTSRCCLEGRLEFLQLRRVFVAAPARDR